MPFEQIDYEEFVKVWQSSENVTEVAERLDLNKATCSSRAQRCREHGVPLKKFGYKKTDWEALKKLAKELLDDNQGKE